MKAILKKGTDHLFTPEFHTAVGGQSVRISKNDLVQKWTKYIHTPAAFLYENLTDLRATFKKSKGTVAEPIKLDMSKAKARGKVFDQKNKLEEFGKAQRKARLKLQRRHKAQKDREKGIASKAKKSANEKAKREAKKAQTAK